MEPIIYAYSGSHSVGKTTAVYLLAHELKLSQDKEVGIILETARMCPYPIVSKENAIPSREAQLWIFSSQLKAELNASRRYGAVVSDRTIVDCIGYTAASGMYGLAYAMKEMAAAYVESAYKEIHFRSINEHDYLVDDGFRNLGYDFRREVELAILSLYSELGIKLFYDVKEE